LKKTIFGLLITVMSVGMIFLLNQESSAMTPPNVMTQQDIESVKKCQVGHYEGAFSSGSVFEGVVSSGHYSITIEKNESGICYMKTYSKSVHYRGIGQDPVNELSYRCAIPLEQLEKFNGWTDHDSTPDEFSYFYPFCEQAPIGTIHAIFLSVDSIFEQQGWSPSEPYFSVSIFFGIISVLPLIFYFTTWFVVKKILHKKYPKLTGALVIAVFYIIMFFPWNF